MLCLVGLVASALISQSLGPEGRGMYYFPVVVAATASMVCTLGLEQVNVFLRSTRGLPLDRISGQNGLVAILMGGIGFVVLLSMPHVFPSLFGDTPFPFLLLAALTIPLAIHTQLSSGLLALTGEVTRQYRVGLLGGTAQVVLLLCAAIAHSLGVSQVLGINLGTSLLIWLLTLKAFRGSQRFWPRWDVTLLGETLKHSLVLHAGMVFFFLLLRLDMFMVKGLLGAEALGFYSLSVILAEGVLIATDAVAVALLPRQMTNDLQSAASTALWGARTNCLIATALVIVWAVSGSMLIRFLFGVEFGPAYLPMLGLLPGVVFLSMQRVCGVPLLRTGRPHVITTIYALSLLCNGALNLWWIPLWGTLGAAIASSVSYGLGGLLFLAWTARLARTPLLTGIVPNTADIRSASSAVASGIQFLLDPVLTLQSRTGDRV
jgi:O-antigen/teichoic acid export membrane protein